MNTIRLGVLALFLSGCSVSHTADKEKLVGAWQLAAIADANGTPVTAGRPIGMLTYTSDGHMSVQLMYPKSESNLSNEYVRNGYEASFGSWEVNETTHTLTHHVEGSNTGDLLVGKDLPRVYRFDDSGSLVIRSANPKEHWSATWQRLGNEGSKGN